MTVAPGDVRQILRRLTVIDGFERPPLNLSAAEADYGLEIVRKSLKQL